MSSALEKSTLTLPIQFCANTSAATGVGVRHAGGLQGRCIGGIITARNGNVCMCVCVLNCSGCQHCAITAREKDTGIVRRVVVARSKTVVALAM